MTNAWQSTRPIQQMKKTDHHGEKDLTSQKENNVTSKENENVLRSIDDQTIRKEIVVPGRLVNLVVSG